MSGLFGSAKPTESAVNTDVTSSVNAIAESLEGNDALPEVVTSGYISYGITQIEVAGAKVEGISTDKGFLYPASLGDEAMEILKDYAIRGFAYEFGADSE